MATPKWKRVWVAPGIYRRGKAYDIRVEYRDGLGRPQASWRSGFATLGEARKARIQLRARLLNDPAAGRVDLRRFTVESFLEDHYLPHIEAESLADPPGIHPNTVVKYRSYARKKVIPAIGKLRLSELTTGHVENLLRELATSGADPNAFAGRPRRRPEWVYDEIAAKRCAGITFDDIAVLMAHKHPEECGRLTKDAVAAIYRRHRQRRPASKPSGLSVSTVGKVHAMLRAAWAFGLRNELIGRDRTHIVAEARPPKRSKSTPKPTVTTWNPDEYSRFFDWAMDTVPAWVLFFFCATSGDRISANLGLRWSDIDLDEAQATFNLFVKYHGQPGKRVLVEPHGKTRGGYSLTLDDLTVAVLRAWKARQAAELLRRSDRHVCATTERACPQAGYHDRGLVFPQKDGNFRDPNRVLPLLQRAISRYNRENPGRGLPMITVHALRHGWSSVAADDGITDVVRMDRLGQTSLAVNLGYTHALEPARKAAAQQVSDSMFGDSQLRRRLLP